MLCKRRNFQLNPGTTDQLHAGQNTKLENDTALAKRHCKMVTITGTSGSMELLTKQREKKKQAIEPGAAVGRQRVDKK